MSTYQIGPARTKLAVLLQAALLGLMPAVSALAAESPAVRTVRTTATLVTDTDRVAPGQTFHAALRLRLAPGWHTYWRNPGDAGAPPSLEWTLPDGAAAGPIAWPTPHRQPEGALMTYGYQDQVVLPVPVTLATAGRLALHATWLVCKDICVPEEGTFALDLPAGAAAPSAQAGLVADALASEPQPAPWPATIAPDGTLTMRGPTAVAQAWFMPDEGSVQGFDFAAPQPVRVDQDSVSLALPRHAAARPLGGVLVLRDAAGQERAYAVRAQPVAARSPAPSAAVDLLPALGLAVLGGLLLNLMPCVFPVLAMKAVGLARLGGATRDAARRHGLAYLAGTLAGCLALAGVLLALRAAGTAAGWGFQFQSPVFVALTACVLFAVGLNFSGVFAVGGPVGAGQGLAMRGGMAGEFFTGLLAVLVATPCSAPFVGVAIGGALAAPAAEALAIFAGLGAGLAAPYVLLCLLPGAARRLPRPGPWMVVLRQALAFPVYATVAWLVWVLSQESGPDGVLAAGAGLVLVGLGLWLLGTAQSTSGRTARRLGLGGAVLALALASVVTTGIAPDAAGPGDPGTQDTEAFTPDRLAALRAQGRPVLVNITAAWCVTCLLNERVALSRPSVRAALAAHDVTYLKGDWTRRDPAIGAYLAEQAHEGVPLYVFYPAGGGAPVVLPQLLTAGIVLDATGTS